jgi:hypothetical protein
MRVKTGTEAEYIERVIWVPDGDVSEGGQEAVRIGLVEEVKLIPSIPLIRRLRATFSPRGRRMVRWLFSHKGLGKS